MSGQLIHGVSTRYRQDPVSGRMRALFSSGTATADLLLTSRGSDGRASAADESDCPDEN